MLYFCRAYSVLTLICVTCFLIFIKLDSDFLFCKQYQFSNNYSSFIAEKQISPSYKVEVSSDKLKSTYRLYSLSNGENLHSERMDNNNTNQANKMGSTGEKEKVQTPIIDEIDGDFSGPFNIKMLNDHLKRCIRVKDNEVDMDEYIKLFQQLYKFFCMLGTLFGFIGSDVKSKIEILKGYRDGNDKTHYESLEKMMDFEKSTDVIHSNKESSGSRTFLRLHRALIFVSKFLSKMETIEDQAGISGICKDSYAQTLAKFHPWLIQKGAGLAMMGLPTKKDLIAKVCANGHVEINEIGPIMDDVIRLTAEIYDHCEKLYTENDLHGLP